MIYPSIRTSPQFYSNTIHSSSISHHIPTATALNYYETKAKDDQERNMHLMHGLKEDRKELHVSQILAHACLKSVKHLPRVGITCPFSSYLRATHLVSLNLPHASTKTTSPPFFPPTLIYTQSLHRYLKNYFSNAYHNAWIYWQNSTNK